MINFRHNQNFSGNDYIFGSNKWKVPSAESSVECQEESAKCVVK